MWYLGHIFRTDMEYVPWVKRFYREARIQGIIVDFEGVLARTDRLPFLGTLAKLSGQSLQELERLSFAESLFTDYQAGAFGQASYLEEISKRCGIPPAEAQ